MNARALAVGALAVALACGPVSGAPPLPAPANTCPDHPCEAYRPYVAGGADARCDSNAHACLVTSK